MAFVEDEDDEDDDAGPLRLVRIALPWNAYLSESATVNIVYPHSSGNGVLSDVVVSDGFEVVAVTLFRRATIGTYADGSVGIEHLDLQFSCVAVVLDEPLAGRRLIDGSSGQSAEPFTADSDRWQALTANDGCPIWIP